MSDTGNTINKDLVRLRALTMDDAKITWKWRNQEEVRNDFSGHPFMISYEDEVSWYEKNIKLNFPDTVFGVETTSDKALAGMTFLKKINMIFRHAEFAIIIDSARAGKGLGKAACYKTLEFAFNNLGLNKVYLKVRTDNNAAVKIYQSCGFVVEGTIRQDVFKNGNFTDQFFMGVLFSEFLKIR